MTGTITPAQFSYIEALLNEREIQPTEFTIPQLVEEARKLDKRQASLWITKLKGMPRKAGTREADIHPMPDVPAGRYAITGEDGTTDFYRVDKPTDGRWKGYTFVKLQLSDDYQRLSREVSRTVLRKIAEAGPEAASKRYGIELGHCGVCGRTLTNPDSIERGIGPVCAGKMEWGF